MAGPYVWPFSSLSFALPPSSLPHTFSNFFHVLPPSATFNPPLTEIPQSQAIKTAHAIYVSGQLPAYADGSLSDGSMGEMTRLCIQNLQAILKASGSDLSKVVKVFLLAFSTHFQQCIHHASIAFLNLDFSSVIMHLFTHSLLYYFSTSPNARHPIPAPPLFKLSSLLQHLTAPQSLEFTH